MPLIIKAQRLWQRLSNVFNIQHQPPISDFTLETSIQPVVHLECAGAVKVQDAVNVTISSSAVLPSNDKRTYALLINDSDQVIYLALANAAVLNSGIRLSANGGSYEINSVNMFTGVVNGIHGGTGNKVLCRLELE